jgi:hypothetical protein
MHLTKLSLRQQQQQQQQKQQQNTSDKAAAWAWCTAQANQGGDGCLHAEVHEMVVDATTAGARILPTAPVVVCTAALTAQGYCSTDCARILPTAPVEGCTAALTAQAQHYMDV